MATKENKELAKFALSAFGGTPRVTNYFDDNNHSVDVLACANRPDEGVTSYCTLGLSDHPMFQGEQEFPIRLEMVGACASDVTWFANMLSTSAFYVMQRGWLCRPGVVLQNSVDLYAPSLTLKHLYFTVPFLWDDKLKTVQLETKKVAWLLAVMITDGEYQYIKDQGDEAFEELLERTGVDIYDIDRQSVA